MPYRQTVTSFGLRSLRNPLPLNESGFVTVTFTETPQVFSWFKDTLSARVDPDRTGGIMDSSINVF